MIKELLNEVSLEIAQIQNKSHAHNLEQHWINHYLREIEWNELTSKEKQNKRKRTLRATSRYFEEEGGIGIFHYENALIKTYDIGMLLLEEIDAMQTNNLLLKRLKILLIFEMKEIDRKSSMYKKKFAPLLLYEELFKEFKSSSIELENLNSLIDTLKILHEHKKEE